MPTIRRAVFATFALSTVLAIAAANTAAASATMVAPLTYEQIAAMAPLQQAKLMNPLREAAAALGDYGRAEGAGVYSGLEIDAPNGVVDLYLTDPAQAPAFTKAAVAKHGQADLSMVKVLPGTYTRTELEAARDKLSASRASFAFTVTDATVPPNGSGLRVGVAGQATATAAPSAQRLSQASADRYRPIQRLLTILRRGLYPRRQRDCMHNGGAS
jgi:hypothetical protein